VKLTDNTVEVTMTFGREDHTKEVNRCVALAEFAGGKVVRCDWPEGHATGHFAWFDGIKHYWTYQG
jgi:hypothetical protein